jgi:ketosteroid isomerase-like protein
MKTAELSASAESTGDFEVLKELNLQYVRSVDTKNVDWFEHHLAADFLNSNPDGSLVDRAAFLAQIARGAGVTELEAHDVVVRILDDVAIIHARTTYRTSTGKAGSGRYTDIWSRRNGRWVCVAAHVTR